MSSICTTTSQSECARTRLRKSSDREQRRMALLRNLGLLGGNTHGAEILRASELEDVLASWRLTHDRFVEKGYIRPCPSGVRVRPYEALPKTATFIAKADGRIVGVTAVVIDSQEVGVPSDKAFDVEINGLRRQGRKVCEGTNWVVKKEYERSGVLGELMRASLAYAMSEGCDDFLGSVSPAHGKFYKALVFDEIGGVRSYSDTVEDPVVLMGLDVRDIRERIKGSNEEFLADYWIDGNPYHACIGSWTDQAETAFKDPEYLRELFIYRTGFLASLDRHQVHGVRIHWGVGLFDQVIRGWDQRRSA